MKLLAIFLGCVVVAVLVINMGMVFLSLAPWISFIGLGGMIYAFATRGKPTTDTNEVVRRPDDKA